MLNLHKSIASVFGIGFIRKGAGSVAAALCCVFWYFIRMQDNFVVMLAVTASIALVGVWSSNVLERVWGHDSERVVIDEVAGMSIALLAIPLHWTMFLVAFMMFRFFDIYKPIFIDKLEKIKGGWGVMLDDILAGVYTNILIQIFLHWYAE